jgi:hypothetical protein
LRRFDTQPRQLRRGGRSASAPCPARQPGGSENPRVMIADRLLIIPHVP